jgi:REP element-mobilizing transposase RayT
MKQVQQSFRFELDKNGQRRGGKRKGAGRTRRGDRDRVSHAKRPHFDERWPLHVTLRVREGLASLRHTVCMEVFRQVMQECAEQEGFRVVHWSVQSNHVHMIVEAEDQEALTRGMKRITIRLAKRWNKLWERKGAVFDDAYHFVSLDTPTQVRNALVYVLQNAQATWRDASGAAGSLQHGAGLRGVEGTRAFFLQRALSAGQAEPVEPAEGLAPCERRSPECARASQAQGQAQGQAASQIGGGHAVEEASQGSVVGGS